MAETRAVTWKVNDPQMTGVDLPVVFTPKFVSEERAGATVLPIPVQSVLESGVLSSTTLLTTTSEWSWQVAVYAPGQQFQFEFPVPSGNGALDLTTVPMIPAWQPYEVWRAELLNAVIKAKGDGVRNPTLATGNVLKFDYVRTNPATGGETVTPVTAGTIATVAGGLTPEQQAIFDAQKVKVEQLDTKVGTVEAELPQRIAAASGAKIVASGSSYTIPAPTAPITGTAPLQAILVQGSSNATVSGESLRPGPYVFIYGTSWTLLAGGEPIDPSKTQVTPAEPVFLTSVDGGGSWSTTPQTGVTYSPASGTATPGQSITVNAVASSSAYQLRGANAWTFKFPTAGAKTAADYPNATYVDTFTAANTDGKLFYTQNDASTGGLNVYRKRPFEKGSSEWFPGSGQPEGTGPTITSGKALLSNVAARFNISTQAVLVEADVDLNSSTNFEMRIGTLTLRLMPGYNTSIIVVNGSTELSGFINGMTESRATWGLRYNPTTGAVRVTKNNGQVWSGTSGAVTGSFVHVSNASASPTHAIDNLRVTLL